MPTVLAPAAPCAAPIGGPSVAAPRHDVDGAAASRRGETAATARHLRVSPRGAASSADALPMAARTMNARGRPNRRKLASRIYARPGAKISPASHHILLPLRYLKSRGLNCGRRQLFGRSCLCKFWVLRRPKRLTVLPRSALAGSDASGAARHAERPRSSPSHRTLLSPTPAPTPTPTTLFGEIQPSRTVHDGSPIGRSDVLDAAFAWSASSFKRRTVYALPRPHGRARP